jgi:hypothetical protein
VTPTPTEEASGGQYPYLERRYFEQLARMRRNRDDEDIIALVALLDGENVYDR